MTPEQLYNDAVEAKGQGSHCGMSLVFSKGNKRPAGFPRGELLFWRLSDVRGSSARHGAHGKPRRSDNR